MAMPLGDFKTTKEAGYNLQGYDVNNNYAPVWVKPGTYVPGISATPKVADTSGLSTFKSATGSNPTDSAGAGIVNELNNGTYNPLKGLPQVDPLNPTSGQVNQLGRAENQAFQNYQQYSNPNQFTQYLKAALGAKMQPGQEELGTSKLLGQAGIPLTMATLAEGLGMKEEQIKNNGTMVANFLNSTTGAYKDQATALLNNYEMISKEHDDAVKRLQDVWDKEKANKFAMDTLQKQQDFQREMKKLDSLYSPQTIDIDANGNEIKGSFNPTTNQWDPIVITDPIKAKDYFNPMSLPSFEKYLSATGTVTTMFGGQTKYEKFHPGVDIAARANTPIQPYMSGTVIKTGFDKGFGNFVQIQDDEGLIWQYGHMSKINVKEGDQIAGQYDPVMNDVNKTVNAIGLVGNTGAAYSTTGGQGYHIDLRVLKPKEDTGELSSTEQLAQDIFNGLSTLDVKSLPTAKRQAVDRALTKLKQEAKATGDVVGIIKASAGGKDVDASAIVAFEKANNVVYQIGDLQNLFQQNNLPKDFVNRQKTDTGIDLNPIWGKVRSFNPWDMNAQAIKASLQGIVPNLARGIYGEVGVLTDNDIKNYSQTLPTLTSTQDVRRAVLGITIRSVQRSIENKLKAQAGAGRDVSGWLDMYLEVKSKADELLGVSSGETNQSNIEDLRSKYGY